MRGMRYQPQGAALLNLGNKFAANPLAILTGAHATNLASAKPITMGGTGFQRIGFPSGLALPFRKNFYIESEPLAAIGTASFVEFWIGCPGASGAQGASDVPSFLTGSSANRSGIFSVRGTGFNSGNGSVAAWGAVYQWDSTIILNSAEEVLTPGALAVLVVVRRQAGMEFWHDGRLIRSIAQAPISVPAQTLIAGAFIGDPFWTSSGDMLLAGRVLTPVEPSAEEIKQFSANVWQMFAAPYEDAAAPATTLTPIAAALSMAGMTATISQARVIAPAAASLTFTGFTPAITQVALPLTLAPAGAVLAIGGGAPDIAQGAQSRPAAGGGGAGPVREVRAFADLLERGRKPTRSQKRQRRKQLEAEALELLPDLPEAEKLAPIAARIVFEQEARALAPLYADRPIQALAPVIAPFDAGAALRELVARLVAESERDALDAEDEFETELLLLGS